MDNGVTFTEKSGMRRHTVDKPSGTPDCYSAIHLPETIGKISLTPGNFHDGDQSSLTVAVRVRPFNNQ